MVGEVVSDNLVFRDQKELKEETTWLSFIPGWGGTAGTKILE